MLKQFLMFSGVGVLGTAAHYLVLVGLVQGLAVAVLPATVVGSICGALVNYLLNYQLTFRSRLPHHQALARFLAVAGVGLLLNALVVGVLVQRVGLYYLYGQLVATLLVLGWGFLANRIWTFRVAGDKA
ncbi:MAG: GtrA family protein [Gammaproteobacteria bacterium]|nr:GtrA family protein [Gammaproteobacteria bacterium]